MPAPEPPPGWTRRLTPRLEALLGLLQPCGHLVDVGTDHALVPLAAVQRGLAVRATGIDRCQGPLAAARRTLTSAGEQRVSLKLGDGLAGMTDADAVVLAGMGAGTIVRVLAEAELHTTRQLVLAPLTEPARVRRWARSTGWHLSREVLVPENGRWFLLMRLVPGDGVDDPSYALPGWEPTALEWLGPTLLRDGGPAVTAWLAGEQTRLEAVARLGGKEARCRAAWVAQAIASALGGA